MKSLLLARISLLAVAALCGYRLELPSSNAALPPVTYAPFVAVVFGAAVFTFGVALVNRIFPWRRHWTYPAWNASPFNIFDTPQALHLLSFWVLFLAFGAETKILIYPEHTRAGIDLICVGIGMVIGTYAAAETFVR